MNPITAPLNPDSARGAIANLQDALLLLLQNGVIRVGADDRQAFTEALAPERQGAEYGDTTRKLVNYFQDQQQLNGDGLVDDATAAGLNRALRELGAFAGGAPAGARLVGGQVRREDGAAFAGGRVQAYHQDARGPLRLGEDTTDSEGRYTIRYAALPGVNAVQLQVVVFDAAGRRLRESEVVAGAQSLEIVDLVVPAPPAPPPPPLDEPAALPGSLRRHLAAGFFGEDVQALHGQLARLGFELPAEERERAFFGPGTRKAVRAFQRVRGLLADGVAGRVTREALEAAAAGSADGAGAAPDYIVRGMVFYQHGLPIGGFTVRLFAKELRREQLLGERPTDASGNYEIKYRFPGENVPLIARVYDPQNPGPDAEHPAPVAESRVLYPTQRNQKAYLYVPGGPETAWTEYEQILAEIQPLLGDTDLADLTQDEQNKDITYLQGQTGWDARRIVYLVVAHKLARRTGLPAALFYGLGRQRLSLNLSELLSQAPEVQRQALDAAIARHLIPGALAEKLDELGQALRAQAPAFAVDPTGRGSRDLDGGIGVGLGDLLGTVIADRTQQTDLLTRYLDHDGPVETFWQGLRSDAEFAPRVDALQLAVQLGAITGNNVALTRQVQQVGAAREIRRPRDLAALTAADWQDLILRSAPEGGEPSFPPGIAGADTAQKAANYAARINAQIEATYPTAAVTHRIQTHPDAAMAGVAVFMKNALAQASEFDLGCTPIERFVEEHPALLDGAGSAAELVPRLKAVQRVFRMAPNYGQITALLDQGVDSAYRITQMGQSTFLTSYKEALGGEVEALVVYDAAKQVTATAIHLMANYGAQFNGLSLAVLPTPPAPVPGVPNWETLFGTLDLCECEHCRSVYSPTAYLAELLAFLKERKGVAPGRSVKDVLFARRPDLGNIELTCVNTNTSLPYVDLVNEILENAVAPAPVRDLPAGLEADLDSRTLSDALRQALANADLPLGADATITVEQPGQRWFITDHARLYRVALEAGQPQVVAVAYQTHGAAADLAANPEHTNRATYERLARAVHPWELPLDLPAEQARAFLGHLGLRRDELMAAFGSGGAAPDPDDAAIAQEYLRLTPFEAALIAGAPLDPPRAAWEMWGLAEAGNPVLDPDPADPGTLVAAQVGWVEALRHVRVLMQQAGLTYDALLDLIELRFINPAGAIIIESNDPADPTSCDTRRLVLSAALDEAALDRTHRLLRLQRKLGWGLPDLDRALMALGGTLDGATLQMLAHVDQLRNALDLPLSRVLALFAPLDAGHYGLRQRPLPASPYEEVFQNPAIFKANPGEPDPFRLDAAGGELADTTGSLADVRTRAALLGALSIAEDDLALLLGGGDGLPPVVSGTVLTLDNLARLYRHIVLARALQMSVRDFLRLKALAGLTPDPLDSSTPPTPARSAAALRLVEIASQVRDSGFSMAELDYLLRHRGADSSGIAPGDAEIALLLDELRTSLQRIVAENRDTADATGDLTRKKLALLAWPPAQIEAVMDALRSTATDAATLGAHQATIAAAMRAFAVPTFAVALDALPAGLAFPPALGRRIFHDAARKQLRLAGLLAEADVVALKALTGDPLYQAAIDQLKAASDVFSPAADDAFISATDAAAMFDLPVLAAPLAALPPGLVFPAPLGVRVAYDAGSGQLRFRGLLFDEDQAALGALSPDPAYTTALAALRAASEALIGAGDNPFLPAGRFRRVLERLLPYLRDRFSVDLLRQRLTSALGLEAATVEVLLTGQLPSFTSPAAALVRDFLAAAFVGSNPASAVSPAAFHDQFRAFRLLHAAAMLAHKFGFTPGQLDWLFRYGSAAGWLPLAGLPVDAAAGAAGATDRFAGWLRLADLVRLRDSLRAGESTLTDVFAVAGDPAADLPAVLATLNARAGWPAADLATLAARLSVPDGAGGSIALSSTDAYRNERGLLRLAQAFALLKRLGTSAARVSGWIAPGLDADDAAAVEATVKARYEAAEWPGVAQPLRDVLRERQRAALVAYLVANPGGHPWRDATSLYEHFLIDVEMSPCMMTSRIKQALSSVQLFVQRCLMNLEAGEVIASEAADIHWRDWKWMKNYRVWEANRKVFLYPENWIEPELRDNKSPFFAELENELLQSDVTADTAEDAFLHYLEKLDEVARLEIVGLYRETVPDLLHVVGRTRGVPHVYYHRRRIDSFRWTAWEKIDLQIEEGPVVPVVWRNRLLLFWPVFTEKGTDKQDAPPSNANTQPAAPKKYMEINLAWSEYKGDKWQPKRTTARALVSTPDQGEWADGQIRSRYTFRAAGDEYGITINVGYFPRTQKVVQQAATSSVPAANIDVATTGGYFRFVGRNSDALVGQMDSPGGIPALSGTRPRSNMLVEEPVADPLYLPKGTAGAGDAAAFKRTPSSDPFRIVYAHQDAALSGTVPFFFQDDTHVFFVVPSTVRVSDWHLFSDVVNDSTRFEMIDKVRSRYYMDVAQEAGMRHALEPNGAPGLVGRLAGAHRRDAVVLGEGGLGVDPQGALILAARADFHPGGDGAGAGPAGLSGPPRPRERRRYPDWGGGAGRRARAPAPPRRRCACRPCWPGWPAGRRAHRWRPCCPRSAAGPRRGPTARTAPGSAAATTASRAASAPTPAPCSSPTAWPRATPWTPIAARSPMS